LDKQEDFQMKRLIAFFVIIAIVLVMVIPAHAESQKMWAKVYSWDGTMTVDGKPNLTLLTSGVRYWVCAIDTSTLETLYEYDTPGTSLTNPVTSTNFASDTVGQDMVAFTVDPTDATNDRYVDLYVVTTSGYFAFVENFDKYTHTVIIDARHGVVHHGMYRTDAISGSTEIDTEVDFPYDSHIYNVFIEVLTADTAGQNCGVEVGIDTSVSGDVDGFVNSANLGSTGYVTQSASNKGAFIDDGTSDSLVYSIDGTDEQTLCYAGDSASNASGVVNIHYLFSTTPQH